MKVRSMDRTPHQWLCIHSHGRRVPHRDHHEFYSLAGAHLTVWDNFAQPCEKTLDSISANEIDDYTRWVALHGGRDLLDAWELLVLNSIHSRLRPVTDDKVEAWRADELWHEADGILILWTPRATCPSCDGRGSLNAPGTEIDPEDICWQCDTSGMVDGAPVLTDLDGNIVEHDALEAA